MYKFSQAITVVHWSCFFCMMDSHWKQKRKKRRQNAKEIDTKSKSLKICRHCNSVKQSTDIATILCKAMFAYFSLDIFNISVRAHSFPMSVALKKMFASWSRYVCRQILQAQIFVVVYKIIYLYQQLLNQGLLKMKIKNVLLVMQGIYCRNSGCMEN